MKRLWSTTARVFWRPAGGKDWASRLQADPIAPRRLEPRRLLDGGVALPVIEGLDAAGDAVQAGEADPGEQTDGEQAAVAALFGPRNRPPSNLGVANTLLVAEDGTATLLVSFSNPNLLDRHTLTVDWGDGSPVETIDLGRGTRFVATDHQYLDDNPTGTRFDFNQIQVTVTDSRGQSVSGDSTILVLNRPPTDVTVLPVEMVDENSFATLRLSFEDRGTLDTHTVEIDWGDGTAVETVNLPQGSRSLVTTHQYLDDNPSGTAQDTYNIRVRVIDDDGGVGRVRTQVLVKNVAPDATILPVGMVEENGFATLRLSFDDPGTQDRHVVQIDWGDGTPLEVIAVSPGSRSLVTTHQYLDDNPTGTPEDLYEIRVIVADDDTGFDVETAQVLVKNAPPSNVTILPVQMIDENNFATLRLSFDDPGTQDTHTVEIDWGDGTPLETIALSPGARSLVTTHRYADDNPTGTPQDVFDISVRVIDDDGGVGVADATVLVKNVPPSNVTILPVDMIDENGFATLRLTFDDPGTEDTHEVEIDWGDGTPLETVAVAAGARSLVTTHQYLDDNPTGTPQDTYDISVRVVDDDTGFAVADTTVLVKNVAPSNVTILPVDMIDENGFATLRLTFDDPGTEDTHEVEIDWGDGTPVETVAVAAGARSLMTTHQYLDDNPTGTSQDTYAINVRVVDDDTGFAVADTEVLVKNVAPEVTILPVDMIEETGFATLRVVFDDPGSEDTHQVTVDWGDGSPVETFDLAAGARSLVATHQYTDDNPTGTPQDLFDISVTVTDDDGGVGMAQSQVLVKNVAPTNVVILPIAMIEESQTAFLDLTFEDIGFEDTHTVEIDWGDGTPVETFVLSPGARSLSTSHTYVDDVPTGTAQDDIPITVRVIDDDAGVGVGNATVLVKNVAPTLLTLNAPDIDSSGTTTLSGTFSDPGADNPLANPQTFESFVLEIDWGDGIVELVPISGPTPTGFSVVHVYSGPPDPMNPSADVEIKARIIDDDTGFDSGSVFVSNPGINDGPIVFVFNPETPRLTFDRPETGGGGVDNTGTDFVATNTNDIRTASGDIQAATDRYFELRFRTQSGQWSEGFRLKPQVLDDLPTLFLKLPDNRWAIFLIRRETNTERLVIEFDTRGGRVIDPGDDTEGARDRPPVDETETVVPGEAPQTEASPEQSESPVETADGSAGVGPGAAAMGLAASIRQSGLRGAAEGASAADWSRLRRRMRKNRPSPR